MGFPKVFTGARAIISMNNRVIAYATSCSYMYDTEYKPQKEVDNSLPAELTPGAINVQVTCNVTRVPLQSATGMALQPTIANNLSQPYMSIELKDRATDQTILFVPKAQLVRRAGGVNVRQMSSETWTLAGIGFWDEREPEGINGIAENTGATFSD